jgi:hypothetical protein
VHEAIDAYVEAIPPAVLSTAQHISTDINFREVGEADMAAALKRRRDAGPAERDIYASFILEEFFRKFEEKKKGVVFQFSLGAEPLPFETSSRLERRSVAYANQSLCTLARELRNFSLAGYWWHNFFPTFIEGIMSERLDMLSASRQIGFFSDAYTLGMRPRLP